jgi:hypothetical protein
MAEREGFYPGEIGYHTAARKHFKHFVEEAENNQLTFQYNPVEIDDTPYREFHGVEPSRIEDKRLWVPGGMVLLGRGVDVGYRSIDLSSSKGRNPYVHDFGNGVKVYRRARNGERPDKVWHNFPKEITVLGMALGFSYEDHNGNLKEVKGGRRKLATTPDRKTLVLIGKGVDYLLVGGNMRVRDWIRD